MFNLKNANKEPFPADVRQFFMQSLASAGGAHMRRGILRAAETGGQFEVWHGAAAQKRLYQVEELRNAPYLQDTRDIEPHDAERFYGLLCKNFQSVLNRYEEAGRQPNQQTYVDAMAAALGGPIPELDNQKENINKFIERLRAEEGNKEEIDKLNKKLKAQEDDFNKRLDEQKRENEKEKKKSEQGKDPDARKPPTKEGYAKLLEQAGRYDIKTIAIMGMLQALCLPVDVTLLLIKNIAKERPTCPADWLSVLKGWGSDSVNFVNDQFGFGADAEVPRNRDDMGPAAAQQAAQASTPKPTPKGN